MAELVLYYGKSIKIGTEMSLYYTTYKSYSDALNIGALGHCAPANLPPEDYAKPNKIFRFRFPFPDEDHIKLGSYIEDFDRTVRINITDKSLFPGPIEIIQQILHEDKDTGKLHLHTIFRDPDRPNVIFEMDDEKEARAFAREIIKNHVLKAPSITERDFYRTIALRMLQGFTRDLGQKVKTEQKLNPIPDVKTPPIKKARRSKRL